MVSDDKLKWTVGENKLVAHTPVFDVYTREECSATGVCGNYIAVDAPDWVMTIPVLGDDFVLVKQWRHASECITVEFPGGVVDGDEDPAKASARELEEETGFRPGRLIKLGQTSPNPALFNNRLHVYLALDLEDTKAQHLDDDEVLECLRLPIRQVLDDYGNEQYTHGLMGTALAFYLRYVLGDKL